MKIKVNAEEKLLADGLSVAGLLEKLEIAPELVAVEVNLDIIPKDQRAARILKEGDEVEIVKFVGGGAPSGRRLRRPSSHGGQADVRVAQKK